MDNPLAARLSLIGGLNIFAGVSLYRLSLAQRSDGAGAPLAKIVTGLLFALGWALEAFAASGASAAAFTARGTRWRTIAQFASAALIVAGALLVRQKIDMGARPSMLLTGIFMVGWLGFVVSAAVGGSATKWFAVTLAAGIVLSGVFITRASEQRRATSVLGPVLFLAGWVAMAGAIGLRR